MTVAWESREPRESPLLSRRLAGTTCRSGKKSYRAVMIAPVQGEGGGVNPPPMYAQGPLKVEREILQPLSNPEGF